MKNKLDTQLVMTNDKAFLQITQDESKSSSQTRITKIDKIQELVMQKKLKLSNSIRDMTFSRRFDVKRILNLSIELSLEKLLDKLNAIIKKLAYNMQRVTSRYRIRKSKKQANNSNSTFDEVMLVVFALISLSNITARAYENDEQSKSMMITSWIHTIKLLKTLLDEKSLIELLSKKKLNQIHSRSRMYTNDYLRVSLATNKLNILTNYVKISINVEEIEALIRAWIMNVDIYDLLLDLSWMRRVHCNSHYESKIVIISEDDSQIRQVQAN